jgi:3-keto-5-aminohexanoate cleavage enzyme
VITQDPAVYAAIADEIRASGADCLFNFTTGGTEGMSDDERLASLAAGPDLASLDCGSMNFGDHEVFVCSQEFILNAATLMRDKQIVPELECFDAGMILTTQRLLDDGLLSRPPFVQFVLGVPGGAPARVDTLCHFASLLPADAVFAATAIGRSHFPMMAATLALGGHVRTGLEDVAHMARGVWADSNRDLVTRAVALCDAIGRAVATAAEARAILGVPADAVASAAAVIDRQSE